MTGSQPNFDAGAGQGGGGRRAPAAERGPTDLGTVGPLARRVGEEARRKLAEYSNPRLTPEFDRKVCVYGSGSFGTAFADRLARSGQDVMIYSRDQAVAKEIQEQRLNSRYLGAELSRDLKASSSKSTAMMDRGILFLAVPCAALEHVLAELNPHPDTVIVNLAKGIVVPGWHPKASNDDFAKGPPEGSKAYLPIDYMRRCPNLAHVKSICMASGPGFAGEISAGGIMSLSIAADYVEPGHRGKGRSRSPEERAKAEEVAAHLRSILREANIVVRSTTDVVGVQVCGAMKNVIALAVGVVDGLAIGQGRRSHGDELRELIKAFGMEEAAKISAWKCGKYGAPNSFCGWPDLNLSTRRPSGPGETMGRNLQIGAALGMGEEVDVAIRTRGILAEGVAAAWGMKLLTDDYKGQVGLETPVIAALVDLLRRKNGMTASTVIDKLVQRLECAEDRELIGWVSRKGPVGPAEKQAH
jgi:glycerol-3-phosphate dehydrogenase (NAD(P)+)